VDFWNVTNLYGKNAFLGLAASVLDLLEFWNCSDLGELIKVNLKRPENELIKV
jgi:hypothetical protein